MFWYFVGLILINFSGNSSDGLAQITVQPNVSYLLFPIKQIESRVNCHLELKRSWVVKVDVKASEEAVTDIFRNNNQGSVH